MLCIGEHFAAFEMYCLNKSCGKHYILCSPRSLNKLNICVYNIIDMNQNSLNAFYLVHKLIIESMYTEEKKTMHNCEIIKHLIALK